MRLQRFGLKLEGRECKPARVVVTGWPLGSDLLGLDSLLNVNSCGISCVSLSELHTLCLSFSSVK